MTNIVGIFAIIYILSISLIYLVSIKKIRYFIGIFIPIIIAIIFFIEYKDLNVIKIIIPTIFNIFININIVKNNITFRKVLRTTLVITIFFSSEIIQLLLFNILGIKKPISKNNIVLLTFLADLIIAIILLLVYYKDIKDGFIKLKNNIYQFVDDSYKYWLIGLGLMMISNFIIIMFFKQASATNENLVQELLKANPLLMGLCTTILAPIIEELVFRKSIYDIIGNKRIYVILSGFIFGLIHVIFVYKNIFDLLYIIPYGLLGGFFAYQYKKSENILSPIFMHFLHNTTLTILSVLLGVILL